MSYCTCVSIAFERNPLSECKKSWSRTYPSCSTRSSGHCRKSTAWRCNLRALVRTGAPGNRAASDGAAASPPRTSEIISDAVGELAARQGLSFSAGEYRVFHACIDTAVAAALEQFSTERNGSSKSDDARRTDFSHELRNALSSARLSLSMSKHGQVGMHSETSDELDRRLRRSASLTERTMSTAQLHDGLQPVRRRIRVLSLLSDAGATALPERNIRLTVDAAAELEIDVDERLMIPAFSNLLQNALKFTKSGGEIILRARAAEREVVTEVENRCGGLPPCDFEELFKPYVQRGRNRVGLGLAITREAVEAHGGRLTVRNLPGVGCMFTVKLARSDWH